MTALQRFHDRASLIEDSLTAAILMVLVWIQASVPMRLFIGRTPGPRPPGGHLFAFRPVTAGPLTYLLIAAVFVPLAFRRRWPIQVLGISTVAYVMYELTRNPPAFTVIGVLVALYTLGTLADRKTLVVWGAACGALVMLVSVPDFRETVFFAEVVRNFAMLLAAAVLGDATRNRRAYIAEVERRAAEAERTREEEARRRVDEERLRIARELHDITAHSLSIVAVQSAAAAHVIGSNPEEARRSLDAIRETSRSALKELRAMLGVLRGANEPTAPLAPAPGLAHLANLVRPLTDAGMTVDVHVEGDVGDLPPFVDASAYRIIQEALTNVLRHAGPAHVRVTVTRSPEGLVLEVTDDGRRVPETRADEGHGIVGMRERATALGGSFEAGPQAGGGWRVRAQIPVAGGNA